MKARTIWVFVLGLSLGGWPVYSQVSSGPAPRDAGIAGSRSPAWAQPLASQRVQNFFKVSETIYRGAQPDQESFLELEKRGIKTVVNLRTTSSDQKLVAGTSLSLVEIPVEPWDLKESQVVAFLRVLADPARLPLFVHCRHGSDRTGVMSAIYRVAMQGWSKEEAIREMTQGGFGYHAIWGNLPNTLRALDIQAVKQKAGIAEPRPRPMRKHSGQGTADEAR
jgi:tyrosine-protein phosphatase SIW14